MLEKAQLNVEDKAMRPEQSALPAMLVCLRCKSKFPDNSRPRPPLCPVCGAEMVAVDELKAGA
jgi:rRNA maturation endonuclease Nob1